MALLIHNFSKLPPPFPAMYGLTVQGRSILRDFSPAASPWAARSPHCPALQPGPSPAAGLRGLIGLFLSLVPFLLAPCCCCCSCRDRFRISCKQPDAALPRVLLPCLGLPQLCPRCPTGDKGILPSA